MRDPADLEKSSDPRRLTADGRASPADPALIALLARAGEQLGFKSLSYWRGVPSQTLTCIGLWERGGGGLKAAVERDRYHHVSAEHAERLVKIVLLTGEELWLRDGDGEPGITTGAAALPVFLKDQLAGAVAALDRRAGQLNEEERGPMRQLCSDIAELPDLPIGPGIDS